jgi:hypothetical protein
MNHVETAPNYINSDFSFSLKEQVKASFHYTVNSSGLSDSIKSPSKKKYRIFFENRSSKKLEITIRYKNVDGKWIIDQTKTLKPGEEQEMGISYSKVYFYHATSKRKFNKKAFAEKYENGEFENAMSRLGLTKQEIWECYSSEACNTFAVFE